MPNGDSFCSGHRNVGNGGGGGGGCTTVKVLKPQHFTLTRGYTAGFLLCVFYSNKWFEKWKGPCIGAPWGGPSPCRPPGGGPAPPPWRLPGSAQQAQPNRRQKATPSTLFLFEDGGGGGEALGTAEVWGPLRGRCEVAVGWPCPLLSSGLCRPLRSRPDGFSHSPHGEPVQ